MTRTDEILEELLERGWTEVDLRCAVRLLEELERSVEGSEALRDLDHLRTILKYSSSSDSEPSGGWQAFEQRLLAAPPLTGSAVAKHPTSPRRNWFHPMALAAMTAFAIVGWYLAWNRPVVPPSRDGAVTTTAFAQMTPKEVDQQAGLFDHVSEVFDDRAKWVAVSDGTADLGLASGPMPQTHRLLLLRLVVSRGGILRSRSDLAIVRGQDADMTLPFENSQHLHYRIGASASIPTRLTLWVELQKPGNTGLTLAALSTELAARPGESIKAGDLTTSSGDYQFQLGFFEPRQSDTQR